MKRCVYIFCGVWVLFLLSACAGPGERFPISFSYKEEAPSRTSPSQQKVVVFPFEDKREDPKTVGRRVHLSGRVDTYEPKKSASENISQLLVASLRHQGWDARRAPSGIRPQDMKNDLVATGEIQALSAEAVSRIGYTKIDARFALNVEILNPKTGVKMTSRVANQNDPTVFIFRSETLQEILNELISSGLGRIDLTSFKTP
jgi:hypothetical protein